MLHYRNGGARRAAELLSAYLVKSPAAVDAEAVRQGRDRIWEEAGAAELDAPGKRIPACGRAGYPADRRPVSIFPDNSFMNTHAAPTLRRRRMGHRVGHHLQYLRGFGGVSQARLKVVIDMDRDQIKAL